MRSSYIQIKLHKNTNLFVFIIKGKALSIYPAPFREGFKRFTFEKKINGFMLHLGLFGVDYN